MSLSGIYDDIGELRRDAQNQSFARLTARMWQADMIGPEYDEKPPAHV
jgi:hypothetical protein